MAAKASTTPSKKGPPKKKGVIVKPGGKKSVMPSHGMGPKMMKGGMPMHPAGMPAGGRGVTPKGRYGGGKSTVKVPC